MRKLIGVLQDCSVFPTDSRESDYEKHLFIKSPDITSRLSLYVSPAYRFYRLYVY